MTLIPSKKLTDIVLAHDEAVEAYQEKLATIVLQHHESLGRLLDALPQVKSAALAELIPDLTARLDSTIPEMVKAKGEELRGELSEKQLAAVATLAEEAQKTRDQLNATLAEGMAKATAERAGLDEIKASLATLAEKSAEKAAKKVAKAALASEEVKSVVVGVMAEEEAKKPTTAGSNAFLDLFKGDFKMGMDAKRGEIWAWNGSTFVCLADTPLPPVPRVNSGYDTPRWALLAAAGMPGLPGSGGSGGAGLPDQTGNSGKFLTTDGSDASWATLAGGGDALVANPLSQFTGITPTNTEFNYVDGVTSSIQTQLDGKASTTHAATHVNGTDDIQNATAAQKGLATAAQITKLDGIEALADVTDATNVAAAGALMESALGTGVETALGVNVGSAGSPVVNGGALGTPSSGALTNCSFPTLNQNTTGSAASLSVSGQTGLVTVTGLASTNRVKTVRDAADTILELGGSYTPTGTWTSLTMVTPVLGTPASGNLQSCTGLPASGIAAGVLGGDITLGEATGQIVLDAALSADGKWSGICEAGTAGATLAFGDLCYLAVADSRWELADANVPAASAGVKLGICVLAAAADGNATTMLLWGKVRADAAFPAMTVGAPQYISTTAGDIVTGASGASTTGQPSATDDVIRVVGFANSADELFFCPEAGYITHT